MTMTDSDAMAALARSLTVASWADESFVPEEAPAGTARSISLFDQTWNYIAITSAANRVVWDNDTVTFINTNTDYFFENDKTYKKVRAELSRIPRCPNDSLIWTGFRFRIVDDIWPFGGNPAWNFLLIHQMHQTPKIPGVMPGQPPFAVHLDQREPKLKILRNTQSTVVPDENVEDILATPAIVPGEWHTYVAKVKFSGGGTEGYAKCWLDGAVIVDTSTISGWDGKLGYNHASLLGPKIGVYRQQETADVVTVQFRNPEIRMGCRLLHKDYASYS